MKEVKSKKPQYFSRRSQRSTPRTPRETMLFPHRKLFLLFNFYFLLEQAFNRFVKMNKTYLITSSLLAALAVALGAFGAHGLKKIVDADAVSVFQTGVQYQMYHSLALLGVGILYERFPFTLIKWAGAFFIVGIVLFSGSLYALTAFKAAGKEVWLGINIATPIGGLFFITGWLLLFGGLLKKKSSEWEG